MRANTFIITFLLIANQISAQFNISRVYSTFDNLELGQTDTFNNGSDGSEYIKHYGRTFPHNYDTQWASWKGWALSNMRDDSSAGYNNQFSAISGFGLSHTSNYMVAYLDPVIVFDTATAISGAYFTNNSYAYFDMLRGSPFSKKFGGDQGTDPDYFLIKVHAYLKGHPIDSSTFYLADFRSSDPNEDYILDDWMYWDFNYDENNDLITDSLVFSFESSDNGQFGMNTPAYFCMDDFNAISWADIYNSLSLDTAVYYIGADDAGGFVNEYVFFPNTYNSTWQSWEGWAISQKKDFESPGYSNQYSPIADYNDVVFINYGEQNSIRAPYRRDIKNGNILYKLDEAAPWFVHLAVTNTAYGYYDMKNGSGFSKKFGGEDATDPDYFRLLVKFYNIDHVLLRTDTVYLADFRSGDSSEDYILDQWVDVSPWEGNDGFAHSIEFKLESSDTGIYGMNTPASFALDFLFEKSSISEINDTEHILVFPNPTHSVLQVSTELDIEQIELISSNGTVILRTSTSNLDMTSLNAGLYFIRIKTSKGFSYKRIIKQ